MARSEATDRIAREAARLLEGGKIARLDEAIRKAADVLKLGAVRLPTHGHVRRHVQGMAMQAMGAEAYAQEVRDIWRQAEEIMTILEDWGPVLNGRAAKGLIDAGVTLHIKIFMKRRIGEAAQRLEDFGCDEGEFGTAETAYGRFERLRFIDEGREVIVTRCAEHQRELAGVDLFTRKPVETMGLAELRQRLASEN